MKSGTWTCFVAGLLSITSAPAGAAILFAENFDSIASNTLAITTTVASMDVIGNVDAVVPANPYAITAPSTVIDLDGTTGPGAVGKGGFNLLAGSTYTLSFVAGGAQRGSGSDSLYVRLLSSTGGDLNLISGTGLFSFLGSLNLADTFTAINSDLAGTTPFTDSVLTFLANNNTSFGFQIGTFSADNIGPLLDSVTLSQVGAVPEPGTLALLGLGLGLAGLAALRRRRTH